MDAAASLSGSSRREAEVTVMRVSCSRLRSARSADASFVLDWAAVVASASRENVIAPAGKFFFIEDPRCARACIIGGSRGGVTYGCSVKIVARRREPTEERGQILEMLREHVNDA